jgi:hypothetical protein
MPFSDTPGCRHVPVGLNTTLSPLGFADHEPESRVRVAEPKPCRCVCRWTILSLFVTVWAGNETIQTAEVSIIGLSEFLSKSGNSIRCFGQLGLVVQLQFDGFENLDDFFKDG